MSEPDPKRIRLSEDGRICKRFSASDADLTLESSDKILFKVHRNNLSTHSTIFPGEEFSSEGEIVKFSEDSEVLELVLQYVYPNVLPDLGRISFELLKRLADAAEKYHIFSAMEICRLHMQRRVKQRPVEVLSYACKYGYSPLSDEAAPFTVDSEPSDVLASLGPGHFARWFFFLTSKCVPELKPDDDHIRACSKRLAAIQGNILALTKPRIRYQDLEEDPLEIFNSALAIDGVCEECEFWWGKRLREYLSALNKIPKYSEVPLPF
ncbi:hypothetical protein PENSPDRAFT_155898 [Peniophora sp. CONT]|nr:hypothetical protein PENSPDRAFT_155898 [Peniophora sp. CONT]